MHDVYIKHIQQTQREELTLNKVFDLMSYFRQTLDDYIYFTSINNLS